MSKTYIHTEIKGKKVYQVMVKTLVVFVSPEKEKNYASSFIIFSLVSQIFNAYEVF